MCAVRGQIGLVSWRAACIVEGARIGCGKEIYRNAPFAFSVFLNLHVFKRTGQTATFTIRIASFESNTTHRHVRKLSLAVLSPDHTRG